MGGIRADLGRKLEVSPGLDHLSSLIPQVTLRFIGSGLEIRLLSLKILSSHHVQICGLQTHESPYLIRKRALAPETMAIPFLKERTHRC